MKIISGYLKGKSLLTINSPLLKPTSSIVKESIFNILTHKYTNYLINKHFLDIFSGTGSIGLEALSRGAKSITLIERNFLHYKLIKNNLSGLPGNIIFKDFFKTSNILFKNKYSLVFLDPPYNLSILSLAIKHLIKLDILTSPALIVTESKKNTFNFNDLNNDSSNKYPIKLFVENHKIIGIKELYFIKYSCLN